MQLKTRSRQKLFDVTELAAAPGRPVLVPDTTVYIHQASGRLPAVTKDLLRRALLFHCSVCLGELAVGLANRDVSSPNWRRERDRFVALFDRIPESRLLTPDDSGWADAGLIAGTLARTQGYRKADKACFNDALIYVTAARSGLPVLTAKRDQFDLIQQIAPEGRFVHYEAT